MASTIDSATALRKSDDARGSNGVNGGFRPTVNTPGRSDNPLVNVQPPRREDLQPSYAQILQGDDAGAHGWYGSMINGLGACIGTLGAIPCCVICPNPYKPVSQGNVGLVTKFGRFYRAVDPGLVKINPLSERLIQVDVKIQIVEVPKQVCMTKDNVTLHLTSVIYYHIISPHKAAFGISNVRQALIERTQTTLRHVVGARVLQDVIERREELAQSIGEIIEDVASGWGVQVESMLIKDIIFSNELQDSLSMAAQSKRIGESKVIAARAEVESAKLMRQAADILSSAPAMQIRYLEAMQAMAKSANSKVIFLPGAPNIGAMQMANSFGEGSEQNGGPSASQKFDNDFGGQDPNFQRAINAHVVENI
ncbi:stomatin-like protein [Coleophoma crateriformis]|uniref:Stomatin-like protein n=1 Tax=Coleophoma crateriformis TaxID=565419 RepID=A0A3D8R2V0_9HELO|nr:stomatin-like protein [Coleophoma crateriformis]